MSIKSVIFDDAPPKIEKEINKLHKRNLQDAEREGRILFGWLFPPVRHEVGPDDLLGNPKKKGKIGLATFKPDTSARELRVANFFLKRFQKWLIGGNPPQKRIRPKHKRDAMLVKDKPIKIITRNPVNDTTEITVHRKMDDLVFKETESIIGNEEFSKSDKRARKKHIQGKYRFLPSSKK